MSTDKAASNFDYNFRDQSTENNRTIYCNKFLNQIYIIISKPLKTENYIYEKPDDKISIYRIKHSLKMNRESRQTFNNYKC